MNVRIDNIEAKFHDHPIDTIVDLDSRDKKYINPDVKIFKCNPHLRNYIETDFSCCICMDLLYPPAVLSCGHSICEECYRNIYRNSYDNICPICRSCNNSTYVISHTIKQFLEDNIKIKCCYGCEWEGDLNDYIFHVESCEFKLCKCRCGVYIYKTDKSIKDHLLICSIQDICCEYCGLYGSKDLLLEHHNIWCNQYPILCDVCNISVARKDINIHIKRRSHLTRQLMNRNYDISDMLMEPVYFKKS